MNINQNWERGCERPHWGARTLRSHLRGAKMEFILVPRHAGGGLALRPPATLFTNLEAAGLAPSVRNLRPRWGASTKPHQNTLAQSKRLGVQDADRTRAGRPKQEVEDKRHNKSPEACLVGSFTPSHTQMPSARDAALSSMGAAQ